MRERFARTASALVEADPRAAVVLSDISLDYFERAMQAHPDRVVNVGIMEQTAIGVAAGMAMEGFHPIVHTLAPFVAERPFEQLKVDFGYQGLGGTFVSAGASYDYATSGCTHHAPGDVQAMLAIPGMRVLVPGHADEVERLLRGTFGDGVPTYLRTTIAENAASFPIEAGRLHIVRRGTHTTVVAVGPMLSRTLEALGGADVTVLYATTITPFDSETVRSAVADDGTVLVVEPYYAGTTALAMRPALEDRAVRVASVGVPRRFLHQYGQPEEHDAALGLDVAGLRRRLTVLLA
ncbi:MAG TPA: transketolase C-terminal domain-containing protein [Actinomycetota bacterium]|jgi:transketolase|nr:transketolase C-terminal domain-containing protein [Actinomycetota bacterium]